MTRPDVTDDVREVTQPAYDLDCRWKVAFRMLVCRNAPRRLGGRFLKTSRRDLAANANATITSCNSDR